MKIRKGFISNSSSSSFIVAFPFIPKTVEEVKDLLFEEGQVLFKDPYGDSGYTVDEVAKTVFNDMRESSLFDSEYGDPDFCCGSIFNQMYLLNKIAEEIKSGWFSSYDGLPGKVEHDYGYDHSLTDAERFKKLDEDHRKEEIINDRRARAIARKMMNNMNSDKNFILRFSYADDDGSYFSSLEHGNLFRKLPHYQINHH